MKVCLKGMCIWALLFAGTGFSQSREQWPSYFAYMFYWAEGDGNAQYPGKISFDLSGADGDVKTGETDMPIKIRLDTARLQEKGDLRKLDSEDAAMRFAERNFCKYIGEKKVFTRTAYFTSDRNMHGWPNLDGHFIQQNVEKKIVKIAIRVAATPTYEGGGYFYELDCSN